MFTFLFYCEPECLHVKRFWTRRGKLLLKNGYGRGRFLYYKIFSPPSTQHEVNAVLQMEFLPGQEGYLEMCAVPS